MRKAKKKAGASISFEMTCNYVGPAMHVLKCRQPHFGEVWRGAKPFEARLDDGRCFRVGDFLVLREWLIPEEYPSACVAHGLRFDEVHHRNGYTGREVRASVSSLIILADVIEGFPESLGKRVVLGLAGIVRFDDLGFQGEV